MAIARTTAELRRDALAIWQAGVAAVDSKRLVEQAVRVEGNSLVIGEQGLSLDSIQRIAVVGAGKAGAGMAAGIEAALGPRLLAEKRVEGWLNVPADCVRKTSHIHLHAARPAGVNEPTQNGVAGSEAILRMVASLSPGDVCLCLISGGASALLPYPIEGVSLADKLAVTRFLSAAGANIRELNTVRKQLSRIKGGGLLRTCNAQRLITLIISDVIGDPLDVIGSGPTIADSSTPDDALRVLAQFGGTPQNLPASIFRCLEGCQHRRAPIMGQAQNLVIGNNAVAVDAAGREAVRLGYSPAMIPAQLAEGSAEDVGRQLADLAIRLRDEPGPDCLISGGEPVVTLVPAELRGLGGRNQQLVLSALSHLEHKGDACRGMAIVSGGTDGEDGPTDAAGALLDGDLVAAARACRLAPRDFLNRNDAYHFFEALGGLIKTGPTHTNVCDVRVVAVVKGLKCDPAA